MAIKACSRCGSDYSATYTMCPKCGNREGQGELAVMKLGVGTTGKLRASDRKFKVVSTGCNEEVDIEFLDRSKERITIKEADLTNSATIDPATLPPSDEDDEPDVPFMGMGLTMNCMDCSAVIKFYDYEGRKLCNPCFVKFVKRDIDYCGVVA